VETGKRFGGKGGRSWLISVLLFDIQMLPRGDWVWFNLLQLILDFLPENVFFILTFKFSGIAAWIMAKICQNEKIK
jgi:hypothetical protein